MAATKIKTGVISAIVVASVVTLRLRGDRILERIIFRRYAAPIPNTPTHG